MALLHGLETGSVQDSCQSTRVTIVGGGIAGLGAAQVLSRHREDYVLLEAAPTLGGHEAIVRTPSRTTGVSCNLDIAYMFGKRSAYTLLLEQVALAGLSTVDASITWSTANYSNSDGHSSSTGLDDEVQRFDALANASAGSEEIPFSAWLSRHNFSSSFVDEVLLPCLTILFVTGHGALDKPANEMLSMLGGGVDSWIGLRKPISGLFRVLNGNHQISEALVRRYGMAPHVRLNSPAVEVHIETDGSVRTLVAPTTSAGGGGGASYCLRSEHIIWAVDPITIGHVYRNPAAADQQLLAWFAARHKKSYGALHTCFGGGARFAGAANPDAQYFGQWVDPTPPAARSWVMSGALGYENRTLGCPHVLSISLSKAALRAVATEPCTVQTYEWVHPEQGVEVLQYLAALGGNMSVTPQVHFAGSWTSEIGHEASYMNGRNAAVRAIRATLS